MCTSLPLRPHRPHRPAGVRVHPPFQYIVSPYLPQPKPIYQIYKVVPVNRESVKVSEVAVLERHGNVFDLCPDSPGIYHRIDRNRLSQPTTYQPQSSPKQIIRGLQ